MSNYFLKSKDQNKVDIINKFFKFENIQNDIDIEEKYSALKRKLLLNPELKKDLLTTQLIINLYSYNANLLINNNQEIRITKNKIFISLKNHDAFRYFFYNNHIEDKILMKIIPHLKYEHFTQNKTIIKEGDDSLKMYIILSGNVSIIKGSNKINILKANENFGQWDVIFQRKRKASYCSLDECHIITIGKDIIKKYLQEKLIKGAEEFKSFTTKFLKKNGISASSKIEKLIKNMKLLYFRKNEIIYNEGEKNSNIYLIYKGEAKYVKKIKDGEFSLIENLKENIFKIQERAKNFNYKDLITDENNDKIKDRNNNSTKKLMEKSEYKTLAILGKGSIGGLEVSTGIVYKKYTLVANSDYTTVIKIELKYIKENIDKFLINLLPIFIQIEKEIHSRFKQIKTLDNMIPDNCQIFKFKKDKIEENSLSPFDNNKKYINEIKKINEKFDLNEGGFIKINDFNLNLNIKKNKLKEQLTESKKKYKKLNSLIKQYDIKEVLKEKYKSVKMFKRHHTVNINKNINNNLIYYKDISSQNRFIISKKSNKKINLNKNKSEKYFAEKTLKNFAEIIENYRKRKEFLIIDIFNPEDIRKENYVENTKRRDKSINDNKLLKEILIINKKNYNAIDEYKDKKKYLIKSGTLKRKKEKIKRTLNIYKTSDDKEDKNICLVNNNILRKLFERNMIKNKRKNLFDIKFHTYSEKRMLYYNTGKYDMPLVSDFNSNND